MSAAENCFTCRWWVENPRVVRDDGAKVGECRRRAPNMVQGSDGRLHSNFPRTVENVFCGQFAVARDRVDAA